MLGLIKDQGLAARVAQHSLERPPRGQMHADTEPEGPAEPVRELHSRRVHECTLGYFSL